MKAIITVSANASQNEQTCIGPNELTRQLVSVPCVEQLISYMLGGGNALTVGVGIVIEVIRKNNSDYDPDVGAEANAVPSSRDPIYLGTLLRLFAEHVPDFVNLIMNAPAQKARIQSTFGDKIEPLGFDRFKTCELMAELLHCSNMGLLNEVGSEELIAIRDAERQRLREEGKLSAMRGEEMPSSADDLTMRISHSSPVDEGRKLEITNISEEDGFEEVAHSTEMTEDTSHEFVKAEDEIAGPSASFLAKDGDDFVDEPLTSPQPNTGDHPKEPQFEEPDLVVAPLSPSKEKAAEIQEDQASSPSKGELENLVDDMQKAMLENKPATPEPEDTSATPDDSEASSTPAIDTPAASVTESEVVPDAEASEPEASAPTPAESETQPEDVDKPAPLFAQSSPSAEEHAVSADEPQEADESEPPAEQEPADEAVETAETTKEVESSVEKIDAVPNEAPEGQLEAPEAPDLSNVQPVVGDFLKMQFVEHNVVPTILSFFFKYPWNNFLHNVVYDIVQQVFNGPMDRGFNPTLAISLFEAADVTTQIINGQQASEESQRQSKTRMGYMGHLTLIAEEVVKFTERHPPELLSETVLQRVMDQEWINYVEGALAETRERDNAILGGVRPEVALSNRQAGGLQGVGLSSLGAAFGSSQGASSALAEAGLNGGLSEGGGDGGNGIGPFAISSGTLMSGFGSSSDEDEDEEAENEEDVNNEVSFSFDRRTRRFSGLSLAAPRPKTHTTIRSVSMEVGVMSDEEGGDEDSDDEDDEPVKRFEPSRRNLRTPDMYDSDEGSDSDDEPVARSIQVERKRRGPSIETRASGPSEDQLFEEVSLDDGRSDTSGDHGRASPDEWEDDFGEGVDVVERSPVQQVKDGATVPCQAEGDSHARPRRGDPIKPSSPPKPAADPLQRPRALPSDSWDHAKTLIQKSGPNEVLDEMLDVLRGPLSDTQKK